MSEGTQDVVARLRADKPASSVNAATGKETKYRTMPSKLDIEAADTIDALSTENTRLREALESFANMNEFGYEEQDPIAVVATIKHIARAALSPAEKGEA